ncbi:MAG: hypothetical protein ABR499_21235 [Gemmatimonadaceae bacterium]
MATITRPDNAVSTLGTALTPAAAAAGVPWYVVGVTAAATAVYIGVIWDISWHMTIGRDTFWSPPHLMTYLAAILVGVSCGYVAIKTSFAGTQQELAQSVAFWGFRAPLGAWVCVWGAFAMLTSAPFDNWWHNAYGLDVKIISPPHTVLSLGMYAIVIGALLMILAWQNRARDAGDEGRGRRLELLYVYVAGLALSMVAIYTTEYSFRGFQHGSTFYRVSALAYPVVLVATARASTMRWAATAIALVYMASRMIPGWVLPLFPAEPKLGPIYGPIDHMVPMQFPLLLVAPAIVIDLLMQRTGKGDAPSRRDWLQAPVYGTAFLAAFLAVQWPFADFLHSPAARNWVFFSDEFGYMVPAVSNARNYRFYSPESFTSPALWAGLAVALAYACVSARAGLAWGRWMRRVRR